MLSQEFLSRFIRFILVGLSGMLVDFGVTALAKEVFKIQRFIANAIGFTLAATTNYFLNRWWTFHSNNPQMALEYGRFILIALIGLGINTLILWWLLSKKKWNFYLCKAIAIGIVTLWNFFMNLLFTFA